PELGREAVDALGQLEPFVPARVVARLGRRRELGVGERADGDHDQIGLGRLGVEDRRATVRAEVENVLFLVGLVGDPRVVAAAPLDLDLFGTERGLHPERASGTALAVEAVADGDDERVAGDLEAELSAVASGLACAHALDPRGAPNTSVSWRVAERL